MTAPTIRGTFSAVGSSNNPGASWSSAPQNNDILIGWFSCEEWAATVKNLNTGWALLDDAASLAQNLEGGAFYYKRQVGAGGTGGAEPVATIDVSRDWYTAGIIVVSDFLTDPGYDDVIVTTDNNAAKVSNNIAMVAGRDRVYIGAMVDNGDNVATLAEFTDHNSGVTLLQAGTGTGGSGLRGALWYKIVVTASGDKNALITAGGSAHAGAIGFITIKTVDPVATLKGKLLLGVGR